MRVIDTEEANYISKKLGIKDAREPISKHTPNSRPLAAVEFGDGSVLELIRHTYSQGLWKYIHCFYERAEVA